MLVLSGALAAINGANVRLIVLNLVTPQASGTTTVVAAVLARILTELTYANPNQTYLSPNQFTII